MTKGKSTYSPERVERRMREIFHESGYDEEQAHEISDWLMEELLIKLGYARAIEFLRAQVRYYRNGLLNVQE